MEKKEFTVDAKGIIPPNPDTITGVIFQRHGDYDNSNLTPESIEDQIKLIRDFISKLNNKDSQNNYYLFTASPTADENEFKRSVATTNIAMRMIREYYEQLGIREEHVINLMADSSFQKSIRESKHLEGSRIPYDNTGYYDLLLEKHGEEDDSFWEGFDQDNDEEKRIALGSEGPYDIANRGLYFLRVIKRYAKWFHQNNPDSKLIVWCGTHYDIISSIVKRDFLQYEKSDVVYVDNCGGITFSFDENDNVKVNINGIEYPFTIGEIEVAAQKRIK